MIRAMTNIKENEMYTRKTMSSKILNHVSMHFIHNQA